MKITVSLPMATIVLLLGVLIGYEVFGGRAMAPASPPVVAVIRIDPLFDGLKQKADAAAAVEQLQAEIEAEATIRREAAEALTEQHRNAVDATQREVLSDKIALETLKNASWLEAAKQELEVDKGRIARRDVGDRYPLLRSIRYCNIRIGQCRTSGTAAVDLHDPVFGYFEKLRYIASSSQFAAMKLLVVETQGVAVKSLILRNNECRCGVQPARHKHNSFFRILAAQWPGPVPQRYLCNCNCNRTGNLSCNIQSAISTGLICS